MKSIALLRPALLVSLLALSTGAAAQSHGEMNMPMPKSGGMDMKKDGASAGTTHHAEGVVKTIDQAKSTVTVAHDPVKSLGWPTMSMGFKVPDRALLAKFKQDQRVSFEFVQQGGDYVVTQIH